MRGMGKGLGRKQAHRWRGGLLEMIGRRVLGAWKMIMEKDGDVSAPYSGWK